MAAHCWGFVGGVLDALYGVDRDVDPLPEVPWTTGLHDRRAAVRVVGALCRRYPHLVHRGTAIIAGDVIVARRGGGPGHVYLAGPDRLLWHATPSAGVCTVGIAAPLLPQRIYRLTETHRWLHRSSPS